MKTIEGYYFNGKTAKKNIISFDILGNNLHPNLNSEAPRSPFPSLKINKLRMERSTDIVFLNLKGYKLNFNLKEWEEKISPLKRPFFTNTKKISFYLLALIIIVPFLLKSFNHGLSSLTNFIPKSYEKSLGESVLKSFPGKVCTNKKSKESLNKMISPFLKDGQKVNITLFKNDMVNAFAAPGNQIIVTTGLLKFTRTQEELLGILLHELGHVSHKHSTKGIIENIGVNFFFNLMLGGEGLNMDSKGEAIKLLFTLRNSRHDEEEADQFAYDLLEENELSGKGISSFFQRLHKKEGGNSDNTWSDYLNILSTHPHSKKRANLFKQLSNNKTPKTFLLKNKEWKGLKVDCF